MPGAMNINACSSNQAIGITDLEVPVNGRSPEVFRNCLGFLLDDQVEKLSTRVGLVPNYFMTRGEDTDNMLESRKAFGHKCSEKIFKTFHKQDFREESAMEKFQAILSIVKEATKSDDSVFQIDAQEIINRPCYKHGDTLLHQLVRKRHLRLVRILLLHTGRMLDFESVNKKGFRPIDLAVDRLEVEMVYLFLLHGARLSGRIQHKNSLGYGEWIGYDLMQNLDTGRWLHRQSEEAIIQYGDKMIADPLFSNNILEWTKGRAKIETKTLAQLGRLPQLFALVLADGCDAITNHEAFATLIRHIKNLTDRTMEDCHVPRCILPSSNPEPTVCNDLVDFLKKQGADTSHYRVAGRTIFFRCSQGDGDDEKIALKISKTSECGKDLHPLAKEAAMNSFLEELKTRYGLQSTFPKTLEVLQVQKVPSELRNSVTEQFKAGYHPFSIPQDGEDIVVLIYRPPQGYGIYANDPSIEIETCISGIQRAAHDAAVLARRGLFHAALVDIQHDSSREERPHLWSFESYLTRFRAGAGRIERGYAGLGAPNVRVCGMGDLKHIITEDDIQDRYNPSKIHAQHNILYDGEERMQIALVEQIGASLFATTLLVASSWQSRFSNGVPDSQNLNLEMELQNCFVSFLQGYLYLRKDKALQFLSLVGVNFHLMAKQIRIFSTREYVDIAETAPKRPIFGVIAKLFGRCSHPTAYIHFAQRGSLDLTRPGRSLEAIRAAYTTTGSGGSADGEGLLPTPRIDTSMMRCSPTWVKGQGWASSSRDQQNHQPHLGAYEGVLPFQQLVRDIYCVAYLSWLVNGNEKFQKMFTKTKVITE